MLVLKGSDNSTLFGLEKKKVLLGKKGMIFFFSLKNLPAFFSGDIYEEEIWVDEEGVWAERAMWLWDRADHLQQHQQAVPVRQHWHGQGAA